jgi:HlyD family secretion protein
MSNRNVAGYVALCALALAVATAALVPRISAEESPRPKGSETPDDKRWQAVAPGRIEPWSGEIKIGAPVVGRIVDVLVKTNDKVFAGEPLMRIDDSDVRARLATVEAQIAVNKRVRNDQSASSRAATRRTLEDSVADAERAVVAARATIDQAAITNRAGSGAGTDLEAARATLTRAQDRLKQQKSELARIEADTSTPLPSQAEGQLNIARTELLTALAAIEKTTIRAPIAATILQVNARPGELAAPSSAQPLVLLGDLSSLRVRAELDERDFGEIKIGQPVLVRVASFRGREFAGKVSAIAPFIEAGRINSRGQRNLSDVNVAEVLVDLDDPGPLAVGMKADVYFRFDTPQ